MEVRKQEEDRDGEVGVKERCTISLCLQPQRRVSCELCGSELGHLFIDLTVFMVLVFWEFSVCLLFISIGLLYFSWIFRNSLYISLFFGLFF